MARTVQDAKLSTREARSKLAADANLYTREIETGLCIGYRRLKKKAGTWWARRYIGGGKYETKFLGGADDSGAGIGLGFDDAQKAARVAFEHGADAGPYTVDRALDDYLDFLRSDGRTEHAIKDATYRMQA